MNRKGSTQREADKQSLIGQVFERGGGGPGTVGSRFDLGEQDHSRIIVAVREGLGH